MRFAVTGTAWLLEMCTSRRPGRPPAKLCQQGIHRAQHMPEAADPIMMGRSFTPQKLDFRGLPLPSSFDGYFQTGDLNLSGLNA